MMVHRRPPMLPPAAPRAGLPLAWAFAAGLAAGMLASPVHAAGAVGCLITPLRSADIGTPVAGVVETVKVERGDRVTKGQVLFTLRAEVERASSVSAEVRSRNEAAVRGAAANLEAARLKYDRARALRDQDFVAQPALEQAKVEFQVAEAQLRHSKNQLESLRADVAPVRAQLAQRTVRAPFDGVVIDRLAQPGERVELQPLLRLADVGRLRVEVIVPASLFGSVQVGQQVTLQPDLPGVSARQADVTQVDRFIDAASNTFRVRLELDNANHQVPAGARCKVALDGQPLPAVAAAAKAAPVAVPPMPAAPAASQTPAPATPAARPASTSRRIDAPRSAELSLRLDDTLPPGATKR
jgi:membrane fusion protein, heavy metal efflux system